MEQNVVVLGYADAGKTQYIMSLKHLLLGADFKKPDSTHKFSIDSLPLHDPFSEDGEMTVGDEQFNLIYADFAAQRVDERLKRTLEYHLKRADVCLLVVDLTKNYEESVKSIRDDFNNLIKKYCDKKPFLSILATKLFVKNHPKFGTAVTDEVDLQLGNYESIKELIKLGYELEADHMSICDSVGIILKEGDGTSENKTIIKPSEYVIKTPQGFLREAFKSIRLGTGGPIIVYKQLKDADYTGELSENVRENFNKLFNRETLSNEEVIELISNKETEGLIA